MKILILPGDGIGPEIVGAATAALEALNRRFNIGLTLEHDAIGLAALERHGSTLPDSLMERIKASDGVVLGPADTLAYPPADQGGINISAAVRKRLDLYANIRPSRTRPGVPSTIKSMDLVIARENTEGFYADRTMAVGSGEFMPTKDLALSVRKITREGCERITEAACELALQRRRKLTIVHKGNVLKLSDGLFREAAKAVASRYDGLEVEEVLVDAMAALLVRKPDSFDVVVTTNMFGDILSDLAAELSGGLGVGGSVNGGRDHAIAQAAHGSAPDIAGKNIANPTAMIVSVGMLLNWLASRHDRPDLEDAAKHLDRALDAQLADPESRTPDLGGPLGTDAFGEALAARIVGG